MIIGVDVDGVLANFEAGYTKLLSKCAGGRIEVPSDFQPASWNYEETLGFTTREVSDSWEEIKRSPSFWRDLPPLPGAVDALNTLWRKFALAETHEVYFITTRPGLTARYQTELWLSRHGFPRPCVLICRGNKAPIVKNLGIRRFIDDKSETAIAVYEETDSLVWLPRYAYNRDAQEYAKDKGKFTCIDSVTEFVEEITAEVT